LDVLLLRTIVRPLNTTAHEGCEVVHLKQLALKHLAELWSRHILHGSGGLLRRQAAVGRDVRALLLHFVIVVRILAVD
jgi:hypothetical protein